MANDSTEGSFEGSLQDRAVGPIQDDDKVRFPEHQITVIDPPLRTGVDGDITIRVRAPGMRNICASAWHQPDGDHPDPVGYESLFAVDIIPDKDGYAEIPFKASAFPHGPISVKVMAWDVPPGDSHRTKEDVFYLQLYNHAGVEWNMGLPSPPPQAAGMSLVYEDDFNGPLSISKDKRGAQYMSRVPWGDFGDAAFEDYHGPCNPFGQSESFLRIRVSKPEGYVDPLGHGRKYVSGIITSVDKRGNGVTATHGYFECRMLCPPGLGTWPAFWLMTNNKVVEPDPTHTVEVDIVEGYGHRLHKPSMCYHHWNLKRREDSQHDGARADLEARGLGDTAQTFHIYGAKVTEKEVIFYIDNIEMWRHPTDEPAHGPMFFMVNLALGAGWPIKLERYNHGADLYVDYVRVFE